jgi:hypothetical protein
VCVCEFVYEHHQHGKSSANNRVREKDNVHVGGVARREWVIVFVGAGCIDG